MSVIKSKRSTSDMEFLATARKLEIYTIQKCVNFPKRYTFYVSQPLAAAATRIYEDVKRANSIYPLNQHEVQIRRDYFLHANAELQSMISQLEVAQELFGIGHIGQSFFAIRGGHFQLLTICKQLACTLVIQPLL